MATTEEQGRRETSPWEEIRAAMKPFKHILPRFLERKQKTCEEYARDEVASETVMWAYIRSSGGLRRGLLVEPGVCYYRKICYASMETLCCIREGRNDIIHFDGYNLLYLRNLLSFQYTLLKAEVVNRVPEFSIGIEQFLANLPNRIARKLSISISI